MVLTTTFSPDPSCYAPSNLWLGGNNNYGCGTYYEPFASRPTAAVSIHDCAFPRLGPNTVGPDSRSAYDCYQNNPYTSAYTAYSDCPEGMTGVDTQTTAWAYGLTIVGTTCCPTAYDFVGPDFTPTALPSVIHGTTFPVTFPTAGMCKATSIQSLSDQTVTLTATASPLSTTEIAWDYDNGFLVAEPARIYQTLYPDIEPGTTSTCWGRCPSQSWSSTGPGPTPAPTGTYVPPPSPAVTQFTPAPTCLDESNLWIISASCYLEDDVSLASPPWIQCTYTELGAPNPSDPACYQQSTATTVDNTKAYYSDCPAGYTPAATNLYKPFDLPLYESVKTETFDVVVTAYTCCPQAASVVDDAGSAHPIPFTTTDYDGFKTVHDGQTHSVFMYVVPRCVATHISALDHKTVTLGLYSDGRVWDKRDVSPATTAPAAAGKRQLNPPSEPLGTTQAVWDAEHDLLFANVQQVSWTVFHGTYTCYEGCDDYFTYSYHNTDPNYTPSTTTTTSATTPATATGGGTAGATEKLPDTVTPSLSTGVAARVLARGGTGGPVAGMPAVALVVVTVLQVVVVGALA
ncbi:hypothetical protein B0J18DRAFT_105110 [Chaetomium sp. MPI-SDFR-AT-0129]|nr:hypothetical protein B0J18DRAFT_105110 [Chaetomium sp. MPI-SDFR-AT-0129]